MSLMLLKDQVIIFTIFIANFLIDVGTDHIDDQT